MTFQPPAPTFTPAHKPSADKPAWWKRRWVHLAGAGLVILFVGVGIGSGSAKTKNVAVPGPRTTTTATVTATATVTDKPVQVIATKTATVRVTYTPAPVVAFTDGIQVVGTDVQPGTYKTNDDGQDCYYARLSSLDTSDILDNDNITGPTTIQVLPTDKALDTSGGCSWTKVG